MSKHIGIIACSYEGAALCYQIICQEATKLTGFFYYPEITMHTQIPKKYDDFIEQDNWDGVADLMVDSVNKISSCGADFAICPDNTAHRVFEKVKERSPIPLISIVEAVGNEIKSLGLSSVGLLGTKYTMEGTFYFDTLKKMEIDVIVPHKEAQKIISDIIYSELIFGIFNDSSRQKYIKVIENLKESGCEGVILGCTEIPLLISQEISPIVVFNSTKLLALEALKKSLNNTIC